MCPATSSSCLFYLKLLLPECFITVTKKQLSLLEPSWEKNSIRLANLQASLWDILADNYCRMAQLTLGGATPEQVVLGCIIKQAKKAMGTGHRAPFFHDFCFSSCLWFCRFLFMMDCDRDVLAK